MDNLIDIYDMKRSGWQDFHYGAFDQALNGWMASL
jgi:hypothetical protein